MSASLACTSVTRFCERRDRSGIDCRGQVGEQVATVAAAQELSLVARAG
jgi:hypothetical protein